MSVRLISKRCSMKKLKQLKSKILMFIFALVLPLSASGMVYTMTDLSVARADDTTTTANYYSGYLEEVTLSNNNFNSSTSTYSISTSLSGWTGQVTDRKTTAGIINVGNTFQNYMTGTYRLSNNPLAKAVDKHILMINSKTANSEQYDTAKQGYKSSSITLDPNSYYSFQVSFKSDTNYDSYTTYEEFGKITQDTHIAKSTFEAANFGNLDDETYISFSYNSRTYYLRKALTEEGTTLQSDLENVEFFYEETADTDESEESDTAEETTPLYVGFMYNDGTGEKPVYVDKSFVEEVSVNEETQYNIRSGAVLYTCDIEYTNEDSNQRYLLSAEKQIPYYTTKTEYTSLNDYVFGSIYLSGLTDAEGNDVKAEYVRVNSKEWVTFYFFVATGSEEQTVTLDLWLGSMKGQESSGVVFFDDCHVYKYSENTFWKTYQNYYGRNYTQEGTSESGSSVDTIDCSMLLDLRSNTELDFSSHNFDFEEGAFNDELSSLKNWTKSGSGNAQVFNVNAPQYFKSVTGYDYVGSNLSCEVELDDLDQVTITPNNHILALWADGNFVKVKSNDIDINSNEIYKVTAYYKISELSSGSVYMFVEENDNIYAAYKLAENEYTLTEETSSSAVSSNGTDNFTNSYGTIEFYIKGGVHYNSSVNISLGLGSSEESATGCVLFDDIKVEKATTTDYDAATNKVELDAKSGTQSIANGNFNNVTIDETLNRPYAPQNWTLTSGNGLSFGGVINTEASQYASYRQMYEQYAETLEDRENPYLWAYLYGNPRNSENNTSMPDNVLMLGNVNKTWQKAKSDNITLTASSTSKISFNYKTLGINDVGAIKVTLYGEDGFKLFESAELVTNGRWQTYEIYLRTLAGENTVYLEIDFGTSEETTEGVAYLDNFTLTTVESSVYEEKANVEDNSYTTFGVVDMTDNYLNLPVNVITDDLNESYTPAYTGSVVSANNGVIVDGGIVLSDKFKPISDDNKGFYIEKEDENEESKKVFFMTSTGVGSYNIDSNFYLDLTANNYYQLTFKVKTNFNYTNDGVELDSDKTYSYGAVVGLTGFDYATGIVSNDQYETYTLYFHATEDASAKLHFGLVCDSIETSGSVVIYDVELTEFSEEDGQEAFDAANETFTGRNYDLNEDKVFVAESENATDDDTTDDDTTTDESTDSPQDFNWLWIPTLITGLAIVIAVIGWAMRKVKIKKIERKRLETYDRTSSLHIDAIKLKAKQQKEADIAKVKETISKFEKELENLEQEHKQKVVDLRKQDKGEVSKTTDKEFKHFAQKRTVIAERIDSLNKQIEQMNSPEYLLNLERKLFAQEEMKQKELYKASKKLNKEKSKQNSDSENKK